MNKEPSPKAEPGDAVKISYEGRLNNGEIFHSSRDHGPLEFVLGMKTVLPALENQVVGMRQGQEKSFRVPAAQAFGEYDQDLVFEVDRGQMPPGIELQTGKMLRAPYENGTMRLFAIRDLNGDKVVLDGNHPLAGHDLFFRIQVLEVRKT